VSQTLRELDASHVLTLEELSHLAKDGGKPAETLTNVAALIARRFNTDVCSVYLLEPDRTNIILAATLGLRPQCVGTLLMALHEGLAGLVAEQLRPLAVEQARRHPRFKYFKEAGEDEYQSFLGVPLIDRGVLQGVLIVQTREARCFREEEVRLLSEAAARKLRRLSAKRGASIASSLRYKNACGRWRGTCGGAGIKTPPACFGISIPIAG
jgi:signal transduction protein with GAF and PtsI domain